MNSIKRLRLGIIGAGNIIYNRHLPALVKKADLYDIVGIINPSEEKLVRAAKKYKIKNFCTYKKYSDLKSIDWFDDIDAVIIGTPPSDHYQMVKMCLMLNKHVLVEKPFVVNLNHGRELVRLSKQKKLVLAVNHNFQFSDSFIELDKYLSEGRLGRIKSIYSVQTSNDERRLPIWADSLPFGLFYDESPHVFYLLKKYAGNKIQIRHATRFPSRTNVNTPHVINIDLLAGDIPISIYANFECALCEWYFVMFGDKSSVIVDLFRDIMIPLPSDGIHLGKQVMRTSILSNYHHWRGVIRSGIKYAKGNLFYGCDKVHYNFYLAITSRKNKYLKGIAAEDGYFVNMMQHRVVDEG